MTETARVSSAHMATFSASSSISTSSASTPKPVQVRESSRFDPHSDLLDEPTLSIGKCSQPLVLGFRSIREETEGKARARLVEWGKEEALPRQLSWTALPAPILCRHSHNLRHRFYSAISHKQPRSDQLQSLNSQFHATPAGLFRQAVLNQETPCFSLHIMRKSTHTSQEGP